MENKFSYKYEMPIIKITDKDKIFWLDVSISKIFRILPLFEEKGLDISRVYICALIYEIASANDILFNGELIELIPKLNILMKEDLKHSEIRKLIFECTGFIKHIKNKLENKEVDEYGNNCDNESIE